jgi:hypothetical protein
MENVMTARSLSERPTPDKIMARLTHREARRMRSAVEALSDGRGFTRLASLLLDRLICIEEGAR